MVHLLRSEAERGKVKSTFRRVPAAKLTPHGMGPLKFFYVQPEEN